MVSRNADPMRKLQQDVTELKVRVRSLEAERPGRKPIPLVETKQRDVCAVDPESDSARCPYASLYRYQHGCLGIRCRDKQHEAYKRRKAARLAKTVLAKSAAKKAVVKKRVVKKAPAKRVAQVS